MAIAPALLTLSDLSDEERATLSRLENRLHQKKIRNELRSNYYDGKHRLHKLGISIPPQMQDIETVIGWPAKSVDVLEQRLNFEGFVLPNQSGLLDDLALIDAENDMTLERSQAHVSALTHGTAFAFVSNGDVNAGDPTVVVSIRSAREASAIYNRRTRRLDAALEIVQGQRASDRTKILYLPIVTITIRRDDNGRIIIERSPNPTGRVACVPIRHRPFIEREFGMSRITRPVMSLTDVAVRTILRTEVSAEFYSSPQRYLLGADETAFTDKDGNVKTGWEAILGRVWAIPHAERDDITDEMPPPMQVGQFPAASMQPHTDHLRSTATMFAGETAIPVSYLGIIHDNPASADAINATESELNKVAERDHLSFGAAWINVGKLSIMMRDKTDVLPPELVRLRDRWANPATPTRQAAAQSVMSLVSTGVLLADSEITWEQLGYDQSTIDRLKLERRIRAADIARQQLVEAATAANPRAAELTARPQPVPPENAA
ncbi:MAG TPA: phage portal protein [Pseudonocardia sp.]|uniref:phage portal protein n=1 Tax=Pseudonocardia sp. TaxID=60912 RepID=UPI002B5D8C44|nr:phage portal protein [Pseudonocardia sp.]HTF53583.1 phage portal protein [Pseudonocardia sp.]